MLDMLLSCLLLGAVAGFLAGLFGIGGGLMIVPVLVHLLPKIGVPDELLMSVALGTSFSTIVITTFSAAQRHNKLGNVDWGIARYFVPALMLSVFIAGLVVSHLPKEIMTKIFSIMVLYLALKMLLSLQSKASHQIKPLTNQSIIVAGSIIGVLSSMGGIAGGAFIVPFLNGRGIEMKKAIGTSSLCGSLLGVAATLSFVISGWGVYGLPQYSMGYIYLPALFGIVATSFFTSKLGANAANMLSVPILKKAFAVFLMLVAINMFFK